MGDPDISNENIIEEKIVNDFCTEAFVEKEFAKFALENDGFQSTNIPELLGKIWYEFINEESWNIIKKYKNPKINYKILNGLVIKKIKEVKPELF
jgi:Fe-S cluster biosynthesis and repair protein YggX